MRQHLVHVIVLLKRLGIAALIFFLCRILFYLFNASYFPDFSSSVFFYGIRFDLAAIAIVYSPVILLHLLPINFRYYKGYQVVVKYCFHICNGVVIALNCIDLEYFKFTFKRTTADVFQLLGAGDDFITLLPAFLLDYWYLIVIALLLFLLSVFLYKKTTFMPAPLRFTLQNFLLQVMLMVVVSTCFIFTARGGIQLRPISIINAGEYTKARNIPLVLNTPFTIIKTFDKSIDELTYFGEAELSNYFDPAHHYRSGEAFQAKNVVLIILESFSKEYIGALNQHPGYTPFLDSLIGHSLVFDRCYANAKESMKGIPAIVASLPSLMEVPYVSSAYSGNDINSLASILKNNGYTSSFFHGGTNGTMRFDAFVKTAGFDNYYGRTEYNNDDDYDGNWGIYDEPFFQYFANTLGKTEMPFFSTIFSLSSHHPYTIPEQYQGVFQEEDLKIHQPIQYTDMALRKFFATASGMRWFHNTLFVITADHTGNANHPEYRTSSGLYAIPLIFYTPDASLRGTSHRTTQQADILPSVLDYLNYSGRFVAFGTSAFTNSEGFSITYINGVYQMISDGWVIQFNGSESIALYNQKSDPLLQENLLGKDKKRQWLLENKLKAVIQSYSQRLIHNQTATR